MEYLDERVTQGGDPKVTSLHLKKHGKTINFGVGCPLTNSSVNTRKKRLNPIWTTRKKTISSLNLVWLVVEPPLSKKYDLVSWDHEIPNGMDI